jgi:hypothetical protein
LNCLLLFWLLVCARQRVQIRRTMRCETMPISVEEIDVGRFQVHQWNSTPTASLA